MKMMLNKGLEKCITFVLVICMLSSVMYYFRIAVFAKDSVTHISGNMYEFSKDSHYEISESVAIKTIESGSDFGTFTILGDVSEISNVNNVIAYEVMDDNVTFTYTPSQTLLNSVANEWHLIDDKTKTVDGLKLEDSILKGALIFQTSFDGEIWVTDKTLTNIAIDEEYECDFYLTKDIQQINGCFYRVIVAYETRRQVEDKELLFLKVDNYEYLKCAEVYEFYLINCSENMSNSTLSTDFPRKDLGTKINTGKDNGFSGNEAITDKDPHYGWNLGKFFINGYTRETKDDISGTPIFLKNVGDRVTLWFNLTQDINCLNGKNNLVISEDYNGLDQYFETEKTNFKHGALIIRYTDFEGVKHDPIIYTDFLLANTRTGANTKVELFEEGDYEVSLNYEIKDTSGIDSYTNYKIFFTFSIRNGNCMVFPFDITSGAELSDNAITENGVRLDMAKSRYLTIDVKRTVLTDGINGKVEDVRFNRPAKDGDVYKDEGIYTFDVKNLYTGESTTKTIYVGKDSFMKAMATTGLSVKELEMRLSEGYVIGNDGALIAPPEKQVIAETSTTEDIIKSEETANVSTGKEAETTQVTINENSENVETAINVKSDGRIETYGLIILVSIIVVIVTLYCMKIKRDKKKIDNLKMNDEGGSEK